jgi:hypothetical protein
MNYSEWFKVVVAVDLLCQVVLPVVVAWQGLYKPSFKSLCKTLWL